ncbi:mitogen-activated protein kinase-binding protein 1 isoform X1 [Salvia splendens]|uniref:mitogen-activated protein kinase-binding protein 1 isoform X1 n=1 Tax=Salvia splendens TaxID=180675 RepID=UPI001C271295|nr:mitogen-activated protein kinase-binding protein 1 isoform X1 [Salvia splendens]
MKRGRNRSKPNAPQNLILEEVIGLTIKNGNGLSSSVSSSKCAYIAGCVVVLYDVVSGTQSHLIAPNRVPKPLSCVALSSNAGIVAAGESGHQPAVLIWNCDTLAFKCEFKCHTYSVACIALSADGKYVVSAGLPRDGYICLWDWQNKVLAARVKSSSVSSPIASIEFSTDSKFIVAAEKNQLKFWRVRWSPVSRMATRSVSLTLLRKVDLGPKELSFVAVTSHRCKSSSANYIQAAEQIPFYAVTNKGTLYMVCPGLQVNQSVELEVEKCYAISASSNLVACACNNGVVKLFSSHSLEYAGGLCYVETKRCKESSSIDCEAESGQVEFQTLPAFPDAIACQFSTSEKLVVVYNDNSLYIWNIKDVHKATRCCVLVSHSGCIWDIKNVPCENLHDPSLYCVAKGCSGGLSFATCSADGIIRLWDFTVQSASSDSSLFHPGSDSSGRAMCLVSAGIFERDSVAKDISPHGFRAMAVSSDGQHLAAGDCQGNIHIFNLHTSEYMFIQNAHSLEVLSLSFNLAGKDDFPSSEALENRLFLTSAGRDGLINLFDVSRNFTLQESFDYHSPGITVVKVGRSGREILSCGADRSLVLHSLDVSDAGCKISCLHRIAANGIIYDVAVDHPMNVAVTVGDDKKINAFDIRSGKLIRWFQHDGDVGDPIKVAVDGSGSYLACAYSNRCIYIYDYATGEMAAQATGHSGLVTGLIFLSDCSHLVSVGSDGCIFVWKLPALLSSKMLQRYNRISSEFPQESINIPVAFNQIKSNQFDLLQKDCSKEEPANRNVRHWSRDTLYQDGNSLEKTGFRFSVSRLPKWARHQFTDNSVPVENSNSSKVDSQQDFACHQSQSLSKDNEEVGQHYSSTLSRHFSETESSPSPSPLESYNRASNTRWLTIHTVCMDFLDTPATCDMKGLNIQRSTTDSICMETTNKRIKLSSPSTSIENPPAEPNSGSSEQANLHDAPLDKCKNGCADDFWTDSSSFSTATDEEQNIYKMNFENFSAEQKKKRGSSMSRSNCPPGFFIRKEHVEGRKSSLCMHAQDSVSGSPKTDSSFLPNICSHKDAGNAPAGCSDIPDVGNEGDSSLNLKIWKSGGKEALDVDKAGESEIMRSCEEALHNLEAAAEKALQAFCKLTTVNIGEEESKRFQRLHIIERKVEALAKLLYPSHCEK